MRTTLDGSRIANKNQEIAKDFLFNSITLDNEMSNAKLKNETSKHKACLFCKIKKNQRKNFENF